MKAKTIFYCTECGNESIKWQGKCPGCGSWNTLVEQPAEKKSPTGKPSIRYSGAAPTKLKDLSSSEEIRFTTGLCELDRVLGGGAVQGSLVLVGGAPGIGKSTLLLQICSHLCKKSSVLYVSGEESTSQIKMRAQRLDVAGDSLYVLAETSLDSIIESSESIRPNILIIDSIQTMYTDTLTSAPGSIGQVKECTLALMQLAKRENITVFVIGHVNKEGAIAGPRVLEHMVDCVLYFEGDASSSYRILRAEKNRFGSTNEIGVFEMTSSGLDEVENPSETLLSGRPVNTPGTCVACAMEGTRPILAEIQALVAPTSFNVPRRTSNGLDYNRSMLLLAVLEKRSGLRIGNCDAYINVIGGLYINETAVDLAAVLAIASSYLDSPVPDDLVAVGEVGLTGELRAATNINQRLAEIARLGFKKCVMPVQGRGKIIIPDGLKVIQVKTVKEAINAAIK